MTDKTKRIILIITCCLLCAAAVIGIATRFSGNADIPSGVVSGSQSESGDPTVNIDGDQTGTIPGNQTDVDIQVQVPDQSDPAQGADSSGTEQTIQSDPVKPEAPERPEAPTGTTGDLGLQATGCQNRHRGNPVQNTSHGHDHITNAFDPFGRERFYHD